MLSPMHAQTLIANTTVFDDTRFLTPSRPVFAERSLHCALKTRATRR